MSTSRVDILIAAKNLASAGINKVSSSLSELNASVGMAQKALGGLGLALGARQFAQFTLDAAQAASAAERVESSFQQLAGSVGGNANDMLSAMRKMSGGMISDTELMLSANKAMMLGVADTADEMSRLLEVAAERGQAMGLTTAQAFNDIVTGIGRQSAMILDNLGIVVDTEAAYNDYAVVLGKTADELTDVEKKQAFLNQVMSESDGVLDAKIDEYQRLRVALEKLREEFGKMVDEPIGGIAGGAASQIETGNLIGEIQGLIDGYEQLTDAQKEFLSSELGGVFGNPMYETLDELNAALLEYKSRVEDFANTASGVRIYIEPELGEWDPGMLRENIQSAFDNAATGGGQFMINLPSGSVTLNSDYLSGEELESIAETAGRETGQLWSAAYVEAIEAGTDAVTAVGNADALLRNAQQQVEQLKSKLMDAEAPAWQIEEAIQALIDSMIDAVRATGDLESAGVTAGDNIKGAMIYAASGVRILTSELSTALANLGNLGAAMTSAKSAFGEFAPSASKLGVLNEGLAEAGEIGYSLERIYSPSGGIASGISSLAGKIQGLFGIGGDTAGIKAEDLLPREDAVNENARRLADIAVNGLKGQDWLGEFAAEVPDIFAQISEAGDPQMAAAQLLRDFQDGLLNGTDVLIDREAAKEKVRRMIMGEQSTAELANSIAQELQTEMGFAMGAAQSAAAAVLGGGGTGTGEAIIAEVRAAESRIKSAGSDAGKQWGQWFLSTVGDGVPDQLVRMLATLVTPHVQDNINTQASRAGAS